MDERSPPWQPIASEITLG